MRFADELDNNKDAKPTQELNTKLSHILGLVARYGLVCSLRGVTSQCNDCHNDSWESSGAGKW